MNNWNVTLEYQGKTIELLIKAKTYSDAYINAGLVYPSCRIISIKLSESKSIDSPKNSWD